MSRRILEAGERFRLPATESFVIIQEGQAEIYATDSAANSRNFILALQSGEAAFPLLNSDAEDLNAEIYAELYTEDGAIIEIIPFAACSVPELREFMAAWFRCLADIPWLGRLLACGDDTLLAWRKRTSLPTEASRSELVAQFAVQTEIFLTLTELRSTAESKIFQLRQKLRAKNQERAAGTSARLLLGESVIEYAESGETVDEVLQEAEFIVRSAAQALHLPIGSTALDSGNVNKIDPVTLLHLLAQKNNLMLRYVTLPKNWHTKDYGVMIGYMGKAKTPCVVLKAPRKGYMIKTVQNPQGDIFDPQNANMSLYEAFICYPGLPEKKIDKKTLLNFLWRHLSAKDCRVIILISLLMGLIPLAVPLLTELVFTDAILLVNKFSLIASAQILAAVGLTMAALSAVRSIAAIRLSTELDMTLQAALISRILRLPSRTLRRFSSQDLANTLERLSQNRETAAKMLTTVPDGLFALWSLCIMAHYSTPITVAVAVVTLAAGVILYWYYQRLHDARRRFLAARGRTAGLTRQILTAVGKFRTQDALSRAFRLWSESFGRREKLAHQLRRREEVPLLLWQARPFILTAIICLPFAEEFSRSQFIAFLVAVAGFTVAAERFYGTLGNFFDLQARFDALTPLLEATPESVRAKSDAGQPDGSIEVSHLSFAYDNDNNILSDVSFRLAPGEYVALVGKSGSGKSTLLRLLLGLETPQSGTVYYNGQDLAELNLTSLRSRLGVVLQDGELAAGDILSNIAGGKPLTEDGAWAAAEAAGIADDIAAMPMGMHTIINEGGANLSGGQRQRLQIASALAHHPAILFFDEATAALDNRTQAIVTATLAQTKATRLIIAHRLSTVKEVDRILVLDKGTIVESGNFDTLMAKNGVFTQLMQPQAE